MVSEGLGHSCHAYGHWSVHICMARIDFGLIADDRIVLRGQQHADTNMTILSFVSKRVGTHQNGACVEEITLALKKLRPDLIAFELQRTTAAEAI